MRNRNLMFIKVGGTDCGGWKSFGIESQFI